MQEHYEELLDFMGMIVRDVERYKTGKLIHEDAEELLEHIAFNAKAELNKVKGETENANVRYLLPN